MRIIPLILMLATTLSGQPSLFDVLHERGDTVVLTLDTDWRRLVNHRKDKNYQPTTLSVAGEQFAGRIRTRGHVRLEVCSNPSLKLKLKKDELTELGYSDLNDLKIVLQCSSGKTAAGYLRREKLLYDLHAVVSEFHHRTVPARVVVGPGDTLQGFFVEAEEQLEARYAASVLDSERVSIRSLDADAYINMCLFNYLILNTDWHVYNLHNVEGILPDGASKYVPIPYDFDYSGLVGTTYAIPRESLKMHSVTEPRFLGQHVERAALQRVADHFLKRRAQLVSTVKDCTDLHPRRRKAILKRMRVFFAELTNDRKLNRLATNR